NSMINSLLSEQNSDIKDGFFVFSNQDSKLNFSNLVSVSFSPFEENTPTIEEKDNIKRIKYSYIGLKNLSREIVDDKANDQNSNDFDLPKLLKNEFLKSVRKCRLGAKNERWVRSLKMLETDPIFKEAGVSKIDELKVESEYLNLSAQIFTKLSSGHKIVLLSITRLVETIEERSLVLLDEPEAYLHPPLLSAFIHALSKLLIERNAVAIIGTHSPVVLQEVPKDCVWKINRHREFASANRLEIESYGENVALLTQEIFGLEVTDSGFHRILKEVADASTTYDMAIEKFGNKLGFEAKAILRNMMYKKENAED
ncbi:AAA family ATPase, partial [Leptospira bourretii]